MYKVMIVDDEPNIRKGLRYIINWEDYNFKVSLIAKNGIDAIEKIKSTYPDLIITDIKMPGLDGLEFIKYVRKELHDENLPFIILSGYDNFDFAKKAIKYNVSSYLLKPIDEDELVKILKIIDNELSQKNIFEYFYNKRVEKFNQNFSEIEQIDILIKAIQDNNGSLIEETVDNIIDNFAEINLHPRLIKIHLDNFLIELSTIINDMEGNIDDIIKDYSLFESNISNLNIVKIKYNLIEFSLECGSYIAELKQNCGVVNKVKQYIKTNYCENIKLKDIAKKYYINSAYLGQLFKKETGLNFSQYLNEVRIENAKKLLRRTNLHVYQIADKVGYRNSDYFIIKFKKNEDCTPMEYKTAKTS